jgi:LuxR family maltose regulon positive regulatory protein
MPKWMPEAVDAPNDEAGLPWAAKIFTLGRFEIVKDAQPLRFSGKIQRKPLALLKALIAFGGQHVSEEKLIHALWPQAEAAAARFSLTSAIYRLRRLLGHDEVIVRREGRLSVSTEHAWVDLWALEALLDRIEENPLDQQSLSQESLLWVKHAAELYRGPFLSAEQKSPWAMPVAERLRRRLLRQVVRAGRRCEEVEEWEGAIGYYEKGFVIDPCAEDVCRCLMNTYYRLGRRSEVVTVYNECRHALIGRLGIAPSAETEALLKQLSATELSPA